VRIGDVVSVPLEEEKPEYPAEFEPVEIVYEDEYLLAVDKPAGMLIHPSRSRLTGTLANRVVGYYEKTGQHCAFHPITRLDRDTFGIVLLAKNSHVHNLLQRTDIRKTYHALTLGCPAEERGSVDAPIRRKPLPSLLREVHPEGKSSFTEFVVLWHQGRIGKLALRPVTGRTHQLRIHCAYIGCPILGDPQYGNEVSSNYSKDLGLLTQQLCAVKLEFSHPITGETLCLRSGMDVGLPNDEQLVNF
jgi:23S rRNA pseudouridine1911/1915/1917 synthase